VDAGPNRTACVGATAFQLFPATAGGTWSGSPNVTAAGIFNPTTVGSFDLTYSVNDGSCTVTDIATVNVFAPPVVDAGASLNMCAGSSVVINASATGGLAPYNISWSNAASLSSSTSLTPTANPTSTTTYLLTVTDARMCTASDNTVVTVNSVPTVNAGADITVCHQSLPTTLTGQSPVGGAWSGTGVSPTGVFTPSAVGSFTLTYTFISSAGCSASDTRIVNVVSATPIDAGPNRTACIGSTPFQLNAVTPGGTWSGSTHVTSSGVFNPAVVGSYNLTYSVNDGTCTSTDVISVNVFGLPTVNAGSNLSLCAGGSVVLNGTVSGGLAPYNISWSNAGSLSSSTSLTPTATPSSSTTYLLSVTDARSCVASDDVVVTVNPLPSVDAGSDITICDQSPAFVLTGQVPVGGTWSGSCVSASGQFSPCGVGSFVVTYSVSNANGCTNTDTRTIIVTSSPTVNAGPDVVICRNEGNINLTGGASAAGTWSGTGIVDAVNGIFSPINSGAGNHMVTLTIGSGSCQVSDQLMVTVNAEPTVNAGGNQNMCINTPSIQLTGGFPNGGSWEGAGVSGNIFSSSVGLGLHNVSYRFTDLTTGCADTAFKSVTVNNIPTASFTLQETACTNLAITPTNTSVAANQYSWNFGVGSNVSGVSPNNTYTTAGTYEVRLIALNSFGCSDTIFDSITVISAPTVSLASTAIEGCAPLNVGFSASTTGENLSYNWNYGNGNTSTAAAAIDQVYIENIDVTNYTASLTVSNACGSSTDDVNLTVLPRPHANFSTQLLSTICSPVSVDFDNNSTGGMTACTWNFGDGGSANVEDPGVRVYTTGDDDDDDDESATFDITLTVENQCGTDEHVESLTIQPNGVNAQVSLSASSGCSPLTVVASNTGTGGNMIQYSYETGNVSIGNNAEFVFDQEGEYTIWQYATDGCGFDTTFAVVQVFQSPQISFISSADEACQGTGITFESTSSNFSEIQWTFGDGESSFLPEVEKHYAQAGTYDVNLQGMGSNGCGASASMTVTVHSIPVAQYEVPTQENCAPFDICPMNTSVGGFNHQWTFGDGFTVNEQQPCYTFTNESDGVLYRHVVLTVSNSFGCADTADKVFTIYPLPNTNFQFAESASCVFPYTLNPIGIGETFAGYNWSVNGTLASTAAQPNLQLAAPGNYTVELEATNMYGCQGESQNTFVIYPEVVANFEADRENGCIELPVRFNSISSNAVSQEWSFGDGGTSTVLSPSHTFEDQGVFDVQLVVTSVHGCVDTLVRHNFIETYPLPVADFRPLSETASIFDPSFTFENLSQDGVSYTWHFGDGKSSDDENPTHEYQHPGTWQVRMIAENMFGCTDEVIRSVHVDNDFQVYIPNSFTPNNDGLNDVFKPEMEGLEFVSRYKFQVYDKWGTVIFESEDPKNAWLGDVRDNNEYTMNSTYRYQLIIEIEQSAETKLYEGVVTVIR
jgi:gliding motility-associated-like protein